MWQKYTPASPYNPQYLAASSFNLRPMPLPSASPYVTPLVPTRAPQISFSYNNHNNQTIQPFPLVIQPTLTIHQPVVSLNTPIEYLQSRYTQRLPLNKAISSVRQQENQLQSNLKQSDIIVKGDQIMSEQQENDRVYSINGIEQRKSRQQHKRSVSRQSQQPNNLKNSTESFQVFQGPTSLIHRLQDSSQNFGNDLQNYRKQFRAKASLKSGQVIKNIGNSQQQKIPNNSSEITNRNQQTITQMKTQFNNSFLNKLEDQPQEHLFIKGKYKLKMKKKYLPNLNWVHQCSHKN